MNLNETYNDRVVRQFMPDNTSSFARCGCGTAYGTYVATRAAHERML
jgi:hypothetical protein